LGSYLHCDPRFQSEFLASPMELFQKGLARSMTTRLLSLDSESLNSRLRIAFWAVGLVCSAIIVYCTRFYINGDAITYVEMGEGLRVGEWWRLANLTYSPGYPVLLGIAQLILQTAPLNEIPVLKIVNWLCFLMAMAACDIIVSCVRKELKPLVGEDERPLPLVAVSLLGYSMFLLVTLIWVKLGLISPDTLMNLIVLASVAAILWIKNHGGTYLQYAVTGALFSIGYMSKAWFLMFSPALILVIAAISGPIRKAIPRMAVLLLVMAVVASPLVGALSSRMGRFSYGELSGYAYVFFISGQGESKFKPLTIHDHPEVVSYSYHIPCTYPAGFDICYWHIGMRPKIDLVAHAKVVLNNIGGFFRDYSWLLLILVWFFYQTRIGRFRSGKLFPPSTVTIFLSLGALATCFFMLIYFETRYWSPFFFLSFLGLVAGLRYPLKELKTRNRVMFGVGVLAVFCLGFLAFSVVDQGKSGLVSSNGKWSYERRYQEQLAISDFLKDNCRPAGGDVAILGTAVATYWGRMAGVRIVGLITDRDEYLAVSQENRQRAREKLEQSGIKLVVGRGAELDELAGEGWRFVPGTRDYYVLCLAGENQR